MRAGFSLIEVLFAVVLVSAIGLALLQNASNITSLILWTAQKTPLMHQLSLVGNTVQSDTEEHFTLEQLVAKYYVLDDRTRKKLKEQSVNIGIISEKKVSLEETHRSDAKLEGELNFLTKRYAIGVPYRTYIDVITTAP